MYIRMWDFSDVTEQFDSADWRSDLGGAVAAALQRSLQLRAAGRLRSPLSDAEIERLTRILADHRSEPHDGGGSEAVA